MKTDARIQKDVMDQLNWDPHLNAPEIGVAVKNGVVTLSGCTDSYFKKVVAERSAKKVAGVKAIAENIIVAVPEDNQRTDSEIAQTILHSLEWHTSIDESRIRIKVENGIVTLEGQVDNQYQRKSVMNAIEFLAGVKGVNSFLTIKAVPAAADIRQRIMAALARHASIDADKIAVSVDSTKVTLEGSVRSLVEKDDAEEAAWAAPGITMVDNKLQIAPGKIISHPY